MNEQIKKFILEQTCASICCADTTGKPYCFSCFYAFYVQNGFLYYKSSPDTRHSQIILQHPLVAGTILPNKLNKLHIRGLQFEGEVLPFTSSDAKEAASHYYNTYPLARAVGGEIWTIQINSIKYTDNSLGFGKKIAWQRENEIIPQEGY